MVRLVRLIDRRMQIGDGAVYISTVQGRLRTPCWSIRNGGRFHVSPVGTIKSEGFPELTLERPQAIKKPELVTEHDFISPNPGMRKTIVRTKQLHSVVKLLRQPNFSGVQDSSEAAEMKSRVAEVCPCLLLSTWLFCSEFSPEAELRQFTEILLLDLDILEREFALNGRKRCW
jgi:hypothetical protein